MLNALGAPITPNNVASLDVWQRVEGGSTNNPDSYNPFNTTLHGPGSYGTNSVGVQAFPDWATGLHATVATIEQSNMAPILAALKGNVDTPHFEAAVNGSPWGTHFSGAPVSTGGGGGGFSIPSPGDLIGGIPTPGEIAGDITGLGGNILADFFKQIITSGIVLRGTLMAVGLVILFIGISQISKGDSTAAQTVGQGTRQVTVRTVNTAKTAKRKASSGKEAKSSEGEEVAA